jgi:hypothetical protein
LEIVKRECVKFQQLEKSSQISKVKIFDLLNSDLKRKLPEFVVVP